MRRAIGVLLVLAAALAGAPPAFSDVIRPRGTTPSGERSVGYTVPEAPPHCGPTTCVHFVTTTDDAPSLADADADGVPDYVELTLTAWEDAAAFVTGVLGWPAPRADGTRGGGEGLTDVYVKQYGGQGGATWDAWTERPVPHSLPGYAIVDDDFAEKNYDVPQLVRLIAGHEYAHLVQFGLDAYQQRWFMEATATAVEELFEPRPNSWVSYARKWGQLTEVPLTEYHFEKNYGSGSLMLWLSGRHGHEVLVDAWRRSVDAGSSALPALDAALKPRGSAFAPAFSAFATETAEWRRPAMGLPDRALLHDVERVGSVAPDGDRTEVTLDRATHALLDVPAPGRGDTLALHAELPAGVTGAVALVTRDGAADTGTAAIRVLDLPEGGAGTVELPRPPDGSRITAVLVNADGVDDQVLRARVETLPRPVAETPVVTDPPPVTGGEQRSLNASLARVTVPARVRVATARRRGVPVRVRLHRPARVVVAVRDARGRRVGRRTVALPAGTSTVRVRVRRARAGRVRVAVGASEAGIASGSATRRVRLVARR